MTTRERLMSLAFLLGCAGLWANIISQNQGIGLIGGILFLPTALIIIALVVFLVVSVVRALLAKIRAWMPKT